MAWFNRKSAKRSTPDVLLVEGDESLEVVGESHHQANLKKVLARHPDRAVVAVLEPELGNSYDKNAVQVLVDGLLVGYLGRDNARDLQPALIRLGRELGRPVALRGRIVGGSSGKPTLGIWLDYDPEMEFLGT